MSDGDDYKKYLKGLTRLERGFLSRRICGLCEIQLHRGCCGGIWERCLDDTMITRAKNALKTYKPRNIGRIKALRGKYRDHITSSEEFAKRKELA